MLLATIISLTVNAQAPPSKPSGQKDEDARYQEIKGYFEGFEVDAYRQLQQDTVFYVNTKMLVYPSWFEQTIGGQQYILITYPDFTKDAATEGRGVTPAVAAVRPVYKGLWKYNRKTIAIKKDDFEKLQKTPVYNTNTLSLKSYKFVSGQLTVPFKLRPGTKDQKFQLTTDVTLGAYGGIRKRLSKKQDIFVTIPLTLGLSYINLNNNNTTLSLPAENKEDRIVPGVSWASGVLFQINKFNAGFVFGKDYASQVADDWIYHNKLWYSFAIGYSFSTSD